MNTQTLKGNWPIAQEKLKAKYAILTDNDVTYVEGREEELIGRIQRLAGTKRNEIEQFFEEENSFHRDIAPRDAKRWFPSGNFARSRRASAANVSPASRALLLIPSLRRAYERR